MRKRLFVLAPMLFIALPALAGQFCSQQTTRGTWEYTCEGYLPLQGSPQLLPARLLGTCNVTKAGDWDCLGSANIGGIAVIEQTQDQGQVLQGHATNNADCTGKITYAQTIFGTKVADLNIRYVIWDGGDRISGLPVDGGQVLACSLHRISNSGSN